MTRAALALATAAVLLASVSACHRTRIINSRATQHAYVPAADEWNHSLVAGAIPLSAPISLDAVCPGGWAEIEVRRSFINTIAWAVTVGLWTPQLITVYCAGGGRYAVDGVLDGHGMVHHATLRRTQ